MRYYFDIHTPQGLDADETGQEFASMEAAIEHVRDTLRQLMAEEGLSNRDAVVRSVVEISSDEGHSEVMLLADVLAEAARSLPATAH